MASSSTTAPTTTRRKLKPGETDKNLNDAKWFGSVAKDIIAQDFIDEILPLEGSLNSKDIFDSLYAGHPDFKDFPYEKKIYDGRLASLQKAVRTRRDNAMMDAAALVKDRQKFPCRSHNTKGEPNWKGSEAEFWLRIDMEDEKHLTMKPSQLRNTRECYKIFSGHRFSKRIDQIKQSEKEFGVTPGQHRSHLGDATKSRLLPQEDDNQDNEG